MFAVIESKKIDVDKKRPKYAEIVKMVDSFHFI